MLRGAGLLDLWPDVLALVAFTAVMMARGDPALPQAAGLNGEDHAVAVRRSGL